MAGPDDREVTMVQRGQLRLSMALDSNQNSGVDKAEREVAVTVEQLADPGVVVPLKVDDAQPAGFDIGEEAEKRVRMQTLSCQPIQLDENGGRNDYLLVHALQQTGARVMVLVCAIHGRVEGARIAD